MRLDLKPGFRALVPDRDKSDNLCFGIKFSLLDHLLTLFSEVNGVTM